MLDRGASVDLGVKALSHPKALLSSLFSDHNLCSLCLVLVFRLQLEICVRNSVERLGLLLWVLELYVYN